MTIKNWERIQVHESAEIKQYSDLAKKLDSMGFEKFTSFWKDDTKRDSSYKNIIYIGQNDSLINTSEKYELGVTERENYLCQPKLVLIDFYSNQNPMKKEKSDVENFLKSQTKNL